MTYFIGRVEPKPVKAGDSRVIVNGLPLPTDFRILAEDEYQFLLSKALKR